MRRLPALLILSAALALPAVAFAQGDAPPEIDAAQVEETAGSEDPAAPSEDPLMARLKQLVDRYYTGIGAIATEPEIASAIESIQFMLLDGVGLRRVAAGVDQAIRLSTPGRRTPFEVAVPLRIAPAAPGSDDPTQPREAAPPAVEPAAPGTVSGETTPPVTTARTVDPATEKRWEEAQRKLTEKRSRRRLYRQWRDRTREKRARLSLGVPLLAAGYAIGFAAAGVSVGTGQADHAQAWAAAIPVVGNIAYMASTQQTDPWPIGLSVLQGVGVGFIVAALTIKIDWPYDRDPMAIHVPSPSGGPPVFTLRFAPSGAGGALLGTF